MDSTGDRAEQTDESVDQTPENPEAAQLQPDQVAVRSNDGAAQPPSLVKWLTVYTLLRLGMLVLLTAVLSLLMPLILALLFAVVLALPLAWLLFGGVRKRVNAALAVANAARRAERDRLRKALNGDDLR